MPKYLGKKRIGFCQRTGFKVRYEDLVEDGELPGVLVEKGWDDPVHPQKYLPDVPPPSERSRIGYMTEETPTVSEEDLWFD